MLVGAAEHHEIGWEFSTPACRTNILATSPQDGWPQAIIPPVKSSCNFFTKYHSSGKANKFCIAYEPNVLGGWVENQEGIQQKRRQTKGKYQFFALLLKPKTKEILLELLKAANRDKEGRRLLVKLLLIEGMEEIRYTMLLDYTCLHCSKQLFL